MSGKRKRLLLPGARRQRLAVILIAKVLGLSTLEAMVRVLESAAGVGSLTLKSSYFFLARRQHRSLTRAAKRRRQPGFRPLPAATRS